MAMQIGGRDWVHWDDLEVHLGLDTHPSVGFAAPFDHLRRDFRDAFRPCSFTPMGVTLGGDPLFTGLLVDCTPRAAADSVTVSCSGYSRAAALEDVNLPGDQMPFEAAGLSMRQIAERLAGIFGVGVEMRGDEGAAFKKVKSKRWHSRVDTRVDQDTRVDDFLVELAKQRAFVRTSNARGDLLLWQSVKPGKPVAELREGTPGVTEIEATFSPQEYYSQVTGYTLAKRGVTAGQYTKRNDRLAGTVLRSMSFKLDDVEKGDAPAAVAAKMGRMLGNAVRYVAHVPSWRTPRGELWAPNTTITLDAPRAMIYGAYEFIVRDVYLKQYNDKQTASLGLCVPGAFSAEIPARMPWEEP